MTPSLATTSFLVIPSIDPLKANIQQFRHHYDRFILVPVGVATIWVVAYSYLAYRRLEGTRARKAWVPIPCGKPGGPAVSCVPGG
jgi:hypothetical protein